MKDDIRNIINFENLIRVRSSIGAGANMPSKNSIVKLIPLEILEKGVKVLIDGKLFIAMIEGEIPLKEEILAIVTSTNPVSLTLNFSSRFARNENKLISQLLKKLELPDTDKSRDVLKKVVQEDQIIIKSKIQLLHDLLDFIKVSGIEYSLLIQLVWNNHDRNKSFIEDLYMNLFDEPFEQVCEKLFDSINELLFSNLPQYMVWQIRNSLIYNKDSIHLNALLDKSESLVSIVKLLNEKSEFIRNFEKEITSKFIKYTAKYTLQKSVFKEFDYIPDFIMIQNDTEATLVHYNVKKVYGNNNTLLHKIIFKHNDLPFKLTGIIREKNLVGEIEFQDYDKYRLEINTFEKNLFNKWGFRSDLKMKKDDFNEILVPKLNVEINKLVS